MFLMSFDIDVQIEFIEFQNDLDLKVKLFTKSVYQQQDFKTCSKI